MPVASWDSRVPREMTLRAVERGMTRAMMLLERAVIRSISKGQPPSRPGEPPHVLTGRLRASITHQVEVDAASVVGRVGTNVEYAKRLEFGFVGTDSLGRNVNQAARPFLRPALLENRDAMIQSLAKG